MAPKKPRCPHNKGIDIAMKKVLKVLQSNKRAMNKLENRLHKGEGYNTALHLAFDFRDRMTDNLERTLQALGRACGNAYQVIHLVK